MKLSIIFLLCLVCYGVTQGSYYQQLPQYRNYRTFYEPRLAYYYPALANQEFYLNDFNEADYSSVSNPIPDYADTEARGPIRALVNDNEKPQFKLFRLNNLIYQLLNNNNNPVSIFPLTTFTSTVLQTAASVVMTTSIKSCIAVGQFAKQTAVVAADPIITYTQPCRRRRGMFEELDAIKALKLVPTPVEQLEYSVTPEMSPSSRNKRSENQPEIASSQNLPIEEQQRSKVNNRQKRAVVTVTSTITTISFTATTVTKNFALAFSPVAPVASNVALTTGLFCLPSGFTVC